MMLGLFSSRRSSSLPTGSRRPRLGLEYLEARDVPTTILPPAEGGSTRRIDTCGFLTINAIYGRGTSVTFVGDLLGVENDAYRTINISGKATGTTMTDENGHYQITLNATGLGNVRAELADEPFIHADVELWDEAPVITSFDAIEGQDNVWRFRGTITYHRFLEDVTIYFGGAPISLQGKSVMVDDLGCFELVVILNGEGTDNGTATAQAVSPYGLQSEVAYDSVFQTGT